ncbi:MAG: hypothetical protein E7353_05780 [Clostridiales bacterium]|nr:hypothetical protein [Clostridiales bacterium]
MAKEQKQKSKIEEAENQKLQERETKRLMKEIYSAKTRAHQQMDKEWEKYTQAREKGLAKEAMRSLKMWNFFRKMCKLSDAFTENLERIESIQDLLNMLQGTCQLFKNLVGINNMGLFRSMKSNLRKFKKKLKQYERTMDEVFELIDTVLDDKPNVFVRFFNKLRRVKPKTDEEILKEQEELLSKERAEYTAMLEVNNADVKPDASKPASTAPADDFGSGLVF